MSTIAGRKVVLLALVLASCADLGAAHEALVSGWERIDVAAARAMRLFPVDWDGDGDLDLFVSQRYGPICAAGVCGGTPNPGRLLWVENLDAGLSWQEHTIWGYENGERGMIACQGDVDSNGTADFIVPMEGWPGGGIRPTIRVVLRPSDEVVSIPVPALLDTTTRTLKGCALADRDGDGDLDLALTAGPNPRMVFTLDGPLLTAPQVAWQQRTPTSWGSKMEEPHWCDVQPGFPLELCLSEEQQGRGLVWLEITVAGFWTPRTISNRYCGSDGIRVGDYDGDLRVDVLGGWECAGTTGQAAVSIHFSGSTHLTRQWAHQPVLTGLTGIEGVEAADLTGDLVPDFVVVGELGDVRIATSNFDLTAWGGGLLDTSSMQDRLLTTAVADFTGDGWTDILAGGETLGLLLFVSPGF